LAVGAQVLVAETPDDLVVSVEARDHQKLFEQLRRLGESVEPPGIYPARHQVVAGSLRRRPGEVRRLDLEKRLVVQEVADDVIRLAPNLHRAPQLGASEIEIPVFEAEHFVGVDLVADGEGRSLGLREHRHAVGGDLDGSRGHVLVDVLAAALDGSFDGDTVLVSKVARTAVDLARFRVEPDLDDPGPIPEIDEHHTPEVARAVDPAEQGHVVIDVLLAKVSTAV